MALHIGVDIGGTKIAAGLIDTARPRDVIAHARTSTPQVDVLDRVAEIIAELIDAAHTPVTAIGIGAPGVIDPVAGTVLSAGPTMPGWAGTPIAASLAERFGLPVAVHNDVRIMGLGESVFGAGTQWGAVLFVSLGTGVGGALVRDGALVASPHCTAGELRRLVCRDPALIDASGVAVIEDVASGPALTRAINRATGREEDLRAAMNRHTAGDPDVRAVIGAHLHAAGEAIGGLVTAIDVEAIVLGGGVGLIGEAIRRPFAAGLRAGAISPLDTIPVVHAALGTDAPIIGAAHYAATH
ncbi:MAG: ROK family protein [Corynebacterium sp.]|uniref:ROK family protein n=1 Tax=Corynebacterium sp. TaxID=1720 RepID=UPI0026DEEC09|nr:ROK family protein [Corynebacterium sp.]MDO5670971.1 ROK family protein [Corynebacterium sp.]